METSEKVTRKSFEEETCYEAGKHRLVLYSEESVGRTVYYVSFGIEPLRYMTLRSAIKAANEFIEKFDLKNKGKF